MKKCFIPILVIFIASSLCSCGFGSDDIKDIINVIPDYIQEHTGGDPNSQTSEAASEYKQLYVRYEKSRSAYYAKLGRELESLSNLKYSFANTVYSLGETSLDAAGLFFEEDAANKVDSYYSLSGYEKRTFVSEGNKAVFTGEKNGASYSCELIYDMENSAFVFTVTKDGEISECLSAVVGDDGVLRAYYNKSLGYYYETRLESDGDVYIGWSAADTVNETYLTPGLIAAEEVFASGEDYHIFYEDGVLSGRTDG